MMWVLLFVLQSGNSATSFTQEFTNVDACIAASRELRKQVEDQRIYKSGGLIATCVKKS